MASEGWIKVHRGLFDHWMASDPMVIAVWVRLISEANFADSPTMLNGKKRVIHRGQTVFGLSAFSDKSGVKIGVLRRIINQLIEEGMISRQKFPKYSIISIVNYDQYQMSAGSEQAQRTQTARQNARHSATLEELQELQEIDLKKIHKKKNSNNSKFTPPTSAQVFEYFMGKFPDLNPNVLRSESEKLFDYYESNGWMVGRGKMKQWQSAASGWIRRAKERGIFSERTWATGKQSKLEAHKQRLIDEYSATAGTDHHNGREWSNGEITDL